jgi:hypothetical protein
MDIIIPDASPRNHQAQVFCTILHSDLSRVSFPKLPSLVRIDNHLRDRRMKILCLHGYGTSSIIFKKQLEAFCEELGRTYEYSFVSGEIAAEAAPGGF